MHKFMRWINQNRIEFFIIIAIIAFIFIIIQTLNGILEKQNEQKKNEISFRNSSTDESTTISKANESIITREKIPTGLSNIYENIIKQFVEYCNKSEVQSAYDMLSNECKNTIYPTVEDFYSSYYERIFDINRMYTIQNWYKESTSCTYYIRYTEDVLATGNLNSQDNKSDYITIVQTDNGYKLNIDGYIGRTGYGQAVGKENVYITVNYVDIYMDFCILNITVKNNTENTICIDTKENPETLFVYDENNVKYSSFLNEITKDNLIIKKENSKILNVKFNMLYNPSRAVRGVAMQDVVLNYDNYVQNIEKKQKISINT